MMRAAATGFTRVLAAVVGLVTACHPAPPRAADRAAMLDGFEDLTGWRAVGSDGVTSAIRAVPGVHGRALRLAVDLGGTAGYGVARRALALELPADFTLSFELRGDIPPNNLELKLIDDTGDNVWWFRRASYEFPASWRHIAVERRQIEFAWGPTADRTLRRIAAIELVVSAGAGGGKGWIEIDDLALDPVPAGAPAPRAVASSWLPGGEPGLAIDGDPATAWASDPAAGARQRFTLDLGRERALGGLLVRWADGGAATDYEVDLSRDGAAWQAAGRVAGGDGGLDPLLVPESGARFVRLAIAAGDARGYRLAELVPLDAGGDGTPVARGNALIAALAARLPRGSLPRGSSGEQTYWTVVGIDGGARNSLLSEDGALEIGGGASLEPFVEIAGRAIGWADAAAARAITQALDGGYLPIPSVTWHLPGWELEVAAVAAGERSAARLAARYTLRNTGDAALTARLVLAVRPLQVDPPTQLLGRAGGIHPIARIAWQGGELALDGAPALRPLTPPGRVALWPLQALGYPVAPLPAVPAREGPLSIDDPSGMASGALAYDLAIPPHGTASVVVAAPLTGELPAAARAPGWFDAELAAARAAWHDRLDRVGFRVPAAGQPIIDTLRTSLAYMLVSRDGPILRPGTRSYARAWIRDGAMIGEALLRLGHPGVAAEFLRWYAPYQDASGKVPCCVEPGGAVPVPEHDSHGELIHLAAEVFRYTHDRALAAELWPRVQAAARYLDALRASERGPANRPPARRALWGLLPPSISHEGYSDRPAYSYWDDFWALAGYRDAAALAAALGDAAAARRLAAAHDELQRDVLASIAASAAAHGVDYIPGAADRGDFDATSTTIALSPGGALDALPADRVRATFERAWQAIADRRDRRPRAAGDAAYTPYELRLVGAFVRLGWRDRAGAALAAYLADRRPAAWNQWAEVVGDDPRAPRFIGDMPHAWVHSDYARAVLDLFACERDQDRAWLIAAGIAPAWFDGAGFAIDALPTPFGPLSYQVTATRDALTVQVGPGELPAGGLVFPWPLAAPPGAARIDGVPVPWRTTTAAPEIAIDHRPATFVIARTGAPRRP
jgi:hypothetical protein